MRLALLTLILAACAEHKDGAFPIGSDNPSYDLDNDDGNNGGNGGGGNTNASSPVITEFAATFQDYPGTNTTVIQLDIGFTDPEDDVGGGQIYCTLEEGEGSASEPCIKDGYIQIAGEDTTGSFSAYIEESDVVSGTAVITALDDIDTDIEYYIEVKLIDAAGNESESAGDSPE